MISFLKKNKFELLTTLLIVAIYFGLRLPNLTLQPIFADEAIYIRWAQIMKSEPTLRFLPITDGKTPLFMWMLMPVFKLVTDPLLAGRLLSVVSGSFTLLGVIFLGWRFFGSKVGLMAGYLVSIAPFMVFFDRLSLVDTMLAAFSIWSLNIALMLVTKPRLDTAMFLGYFLGLGMLTKTPASLNILALPFTALAFDFSKRQKLVKLFIFWLVSIGLTLVIYNILRLGPGFSNLSSRNQDYVFSPVELIYRPWDPFFPHMGDIKSWFNIFLTLPVVGLLGYGILIGIKKFNKYLLAVLIWALIPLLIEMAFLKTFTARYILSSIPPLLLVSGFGLNQLLRIKKFNKLLLGLIVVAVSIMPLKFDLQLLKDPQSVNLPRNERRGYFEDWTAGPGLKEIAQYLMSESKKQSVVVATEGHFGTLPDGLQIYLDTYNHQSDKNHQVVVVGSEATVSAELIESASSHPTYFVANKSRYYSWRNVELIKEFPKAIGSDIAPDSMLLFKVKP